MSSSGKEKCLKVDAVLARKHKVPFARQGCERCKQQGGGASPIHRSGLLWVATLKENAGTVAKMNEASGFWSTVSLQ